MQTNALMFEINDSQKPVTFRFCLDVTNRRALLTEYWNCRRRSRGKGVRSQEIFSILAAYINNKTNGTDGTNRTDDRNPIHRAIVSSSLAPDSFPSMR